MKRQTEDGEETQGVFLLNQKPVLKRTLHKSIDESANYASINLARVNKLRLCDASLRQKLEPLLGYVYTLALTNMLTLLGNQTDCFLQK